MVEYYGAVEEALFFGAVDVDGIGGDEGKTPVGYQLEALVVKYRTVLEHAAHFGKVCTDNVFERWMLNNNLLRLPAGKKQDGY